MINKTKIKWQLLLIALLLFSLNTSAQIKPIVNTVIPPSPTSVAFRQFAGYTPGLSTGTVNVPIPLYNVEVGNFSLPISLQYYTQGIKFTDDPYPAGYGWMLNPGLRITRTIMGRPDFYFPLDVRSTDINFDYCKKAVYDETSQKHVGWTYDKLLDTQHDIFTIHLPHSNYTFLLDKVNGVYTAITANNHLRITSQNLSSFEVIDENGVIYYFGEASGSSGSSFVEIYKNYETSWMLRKIVLPGSNREINFTWEKVRHSDLRFGPYFGGDVLKDYKEQWNQYVPTNKNPEYTSAEELGLLSEYGIYNEVLHLKQIAFPGGTVDFSHKSTLKPLLTDIKVKNLNNVIVRTVSFSYGTGFDERLLQKISFSDEGTYTFQYHAQRFKDPNSQDYWGYFNGKNNNSLVPRMQIKTYNTRISGGYTSYTYYGTADRSIDADCMKACMLTKVTYPTGGYTSFEYEPHQFQGSIPLTPGLSDASKVRLTQGGGLRVTKVTSSAGHDAPEFVKTYKYGESENGQAKVIYEPTLDTFIDELSGYNGEVVSLGSIIGYNHRTLFLNSQSNYMRYAINTPALWYDVVTEYVGGEAKTVYNYQRHVSENAISTLYTVLDFPYQSIFKYNNLFSKGCLLTQQTDYSKSGNTYSPVRQTTYTYSVKEDMSKSVNDLVVNRMGISMLTNGPDFEYSGGKLLCGQYSIMGRAISLDYKSNPCNFKLYYEQLDSETTIHYTSTGNIAEQTTYGYSGIYPVSKTVTGSNGQSCTESYLYPKDYAQATTSAQQSLLSDMLSKNIKFPAYKTVRTQNGKSEQERKEFKDFGNNLYLPEKQFYQRGNEPEVCQAIYDYDIKGNLQSCVENGVIKHTYLWGYNYTCPVAIIDGLDYTETAALVDRTDLVILNGATWNIPSALNSIRSKIDTKALMTSYLHEPLIGISSVTSPNGGITRYLYDSANRLKSVQDHNSQTLQCFAYHRRGETLALSFNAESSYAHGTNLSATAIVTNGSELYNLVWTLKNTAGTVLYTSEASESKSVTVPLQQSGSMTLTCNVTDKLTGEVQSYSRSFTVAPAIVGFNSVNQGIGSVSASIDCPGTCTIEFYIIAEMASDGCAIFYLDGKRYDLYNTEGTNVSLTLDAGSHHFSISLNTMDSNNSAQLIITGVSSPYSIGKISSIQAFN